MKDAKRAAILDAAISVFCRQGFDAAKIDEIAANAGVGKGTVYLYFPSKQALWQEVFDYCNIADVKACQEGLDNEKNALDKLCRRLHNATRWALDNPQMARMEHLVLSRPEYQNGRYQAQSRQFVCVDALIKSGIEKGEIRNMPSELLGEIFYGIGAAVFHYVMEQPEKMADKKFWNDCFDCVKSSLRA